MLKKVGISSLWALTLVMSGCGSSTGESQLEIQQMLDKRYFTGVISKVESSAQSKDDYLTLGSAYMGKAGFTLSDVIGAFATSDSTQQGDAFANYVTTVVGEDPSPTAFSDLEKANLYYTKVVSDYCTSKTKVLSSSEEDICLYIGLALTTKAATTINLLSDNIGTFGTGEVDTKLQASACALQYTIDATQVSSQCTVTSKSNVTFEESKKTYGRIDVYVNGESNEFLLTNNNRETLLTVGFCPNDDFSKREDEKQSNYYPCPVNETAGSEDVTTGSVLVTTLNDGLDVVKNVAPAEMQESVEEFKCDLIDGHYNGQSCSKNSTITKQIVIDYLNKNN